MKILFLHPNMPGQYKHLAPYFAKDSGNQVVFITKPRPEVKLPGVHKIEYKTRREPSRETHRYLIGTERSVLQGQEVWRLCKKLKAEEGFTPDVVCAHPGWGDALYIKDIYPDAPVLGFFEFYYKSQGSDVGFDPNEKISDDDKARIRTKNITNLLSLADADWGVSPTRWQWEQHPEEFRGKLSVLHDGIDTDAARPDAGAKVRLKNGITLTKDDEVITYVARNFEPYRGFGTFMQAAELILKRRPNAHILAIGADGVSYGKQAQGGGTYRQQWMKKVTLDEKRVHFLGTLNYPDFMRVLQVSSAHIYLTYPFVLSWSMLEAMSAGCAVIGSATPPVEEVIRHGENGLLADFFSPKDVAQRVDDILDHKDRMKKMREAARQTVVERYDIKTLLPLHVKLVEDVAARKFPPPAAAAIEKLYAPAAAKKRRKA